VRIHVLRVEIAVGSHRIPRRIRMAHIGVQARIVEVGNFSGLAALELGGAQDDAADPQRAKTLACM
jgi:hypothetical protein